MDEFCIRKATVEDYNGVLAIGEIYSGRDYIPHHYKKYLELYNSYVGVIGEEIVAFGCERLIDGGQSLETAALRVKEAHQGKGYLGTMLKYIFASYQHVPSLLNETMTTNPVNLSINGDRIRKKYRQILDRPLVEYTSKAEDFIFANFLKEQSTTVHEMDSTHLFQLFQNRQLCKKIFPADRLIVSWHPYRLQEANIPLMMAQHKYWATYQGETINTISGLEWYFLKPTSMIYKLDIFGFDVSDMKAHIVHHLRQIGKLVASEKPENLILHISYPDDLDSKIVTEMLQFCGLEKSSWDVNRLFLFEREFSACSQ